MAHHPARKPARVIAPAALAVCAIAIFAVVLGSSTWDDGDDRASERTTPTTRAKAGRPRTRTRASTYTVKTGDTLAGIADKTGLSVERLQELNPQLDPQALVSGQKIKLAE